MSATIERHDWRRSGSLPPPDPPLVRDVARLALLGAAALMAVGSLIPWAIGFDGVGRVEDFRATARSGEGVVLIASALFLVFLARNRLLWETASRTVQLLPVLVALLSGAMWLGVEHYARQMIAEWELRGGGGELTFARYMVLAAIGLVLFVVAWIEWKRPADVRQRMRPLVVELGLTRWSAVAIALPLVFGALGASLSTLAIVHLAGIEGMLPAVILGVFGLFGGIALGVRVAGWLESRAR